MIVTAQPNELYFAWQSKVQIQNFKSYGIDLSTYYVLILIKENDTLNPEFINLKRDYPEINVILYSDKDKSKGNYVSTVRPYLLRKFFEDEFHKSIDKSSFLYIDSDVVLTKSLDINKYLNKDVWYMSNCFAYLNSKIIKESFSETYNYMLELFSIEDSLLMNNEDNVGGAQYFLKNTDVEFWKEVEEKSERLFNILTEQSSYYAKKGQKFIQVWCSDMWTIRWLSLKRGDIHKTVEDLDFSWSYDDIKNWHKNTFYHNAGAHAYRSIELFKKWEYKNSIPDNLLLEKLNPNYCSYNYAKEVLKTYNGGTSKIDLKDVTFLIPVRIDSDDRINNLYTILNWIDKNFNTNVIVLESDYIPKVDYRIIPNISYHFSYSVNFHRTRLLNEGMRLSKTNIVCFMDSDCLAKVQDTLLAVEEVRNDDKTISFPYDGMFNNISSSSVPYVLNEKNMTTIPSLGYVKDSVGGMLFLNRNEYLKIGGENEKFNSWGFEDKERVTRGVKLGMYVKRTTGTLFHINHYRGIYSNSNSSYKNLEEEYEKVKNISKEELINYIKTW